MRSSPLPARSTGNGNLRQNDPPRQTVGLPGSPLLGMVLASGSLALFLHPNAGRESEVRLRKVTAGIALAGFGLALSVAPTKVLAEQAAPGCSSASSRE